MSSKAEDPERQRSRDRNLTLRLRWLVLRISRTSGTSRSSRPARNVPRRLVTPGQINAIELDLMGEYRRRKPLLIPREKVTFEEASAIPPVLIE